MNCSIIIIKKTKKYLMKNNLLIFGGVGVLVVGLVGFLIINGGNNGNEVEMMGKSDVMENTEEAMVTDDKMEKTQDEVTSKLPRPGSNILLDVP